MRRELLRPKRPQRLQHPLPDLLFAKSELTWGEGYILLDGRGEERRLGELEDEADPAPQLALFERRRIHAVDEHLATRRNEEQIHVLYERALARARATDDREHLSRLHDERHASQRLDLEGGAPCVDMPDVPELQLHRDLVPLCVLASMTSASSSGVRSFAGARPSSSASLGTTGRTSLFSRRRSALEKNRSGVSSATSSPPFRTRIRSAPVSSSRWWVTCRTVFSDCRAWRYSRTSMRPAESSMEVGSSRTSISGSATRRPARATRCFSPPERVWGSRRSKPSRPTVRIALATLSRISSRGTPRFSRPKATSSSTKGATRPFSGFWKRTPRCLRTSKGSVAGSRPETSTRPDSGLRRPFKRRTRVDLPPPFGPTTPTYSPGRRSRLTSERAGRAEPG